MSQANGHTPLPSARVVTAVVWAAAAFLAWCAAWRLPAAGPEVGAALTVAALVTELVGMALRLKPKGLRSAVESEVVWTTAWLGQINALGFIALISPSLASILPALVVTALIEAVLAQRGPCGRIERTVGADGVHLFTDNESTSADAAVSAETMRSTEEGRSADGTRFLSGWVRFALELGQKNTHVTIGFSPPFMGVPDVELDQEADCLAIDPRGTGSEEEMDEDAVWSTCDLQVQHASPAGMRVAIKRSDARSAYRGKLLWHASLAPTQNGQPESAVMLREQLP